MSDNEKVNILMVDDQPAKLLTYEAILADLGENLIKVTSGREALDQLLHNDIAVVLMDVSMPEIDGFEMAEMIRQHPRFQKTAIIFISGVHLSDTDKIRGYQRGAVDYISVPVVPEVLRAKVSVFVELHRKTRQLELLNRELERRVEERTQELRESENQLEQRVTELETVMQVLPVGIALAHDSAGDYITGNAALCRLLGVEADANLSNQNTNGLQYKAFRNGRELSSDELPVQKAARTGKPVGSAELQVTLKNGTTKHLLASASPLFDDAGAVRGAVGAFYDLTERKQMEDMLRERAELLELATEAVMVRDMEGVLHYWNSGAEALYGWKREEVLGKNIHQILNTAFPVPYEEVESALTMLGVWDGNLVQETKDHHKVTVASRKAFNRERRAILEINRDITSRLRAEDALRQTEKLAAMGRVAGIIAHEINNPLESITNAFFLLRDHPSLDEEARHYASLAEQELVRVSHITRQTLSFYRESKQPVPLSVPELLDDVLELQKRRMQLNRIELETNYQTKGKINAFPVELKQVFLNLLGNAIQAMPQGGRLRVNVRESGTCNGDVPGIFISIVDTGSGIRPEDAKHLFEPFFSTKSEKGTGLGLWISRGIIQKYDGDIRFRSILSPRGNLTCFRVFMPLVRVHQKAAAESGSEPALEGRLARGHRG